MKFARSSLPGRLCELQRIAGTPSRLVVAFSGGLDSSVLLHALAGTRARHGYEILAAHVDHGLQHGSAGWARHCRRFADDLGVAFSAMQVSVDAGSRLGPEAAARQARYDALRGCMQPGDWLVSAHHADDQAETVLLNLMRGSGVLGLAGIPRARRFAAGWLVRPLLDVPRRDLEAYVTRHAIVHIDDPSNSEQQFDRNFLRHEILTRLETRWPDAAGRIKKSAEFARETSELLAALAEVDRQQCADRGDRVALSALATLPAARQRNLLRYLIGETGLPPAGAVHLEQIVNELIPARTDAQPLVAWPGGVARRYRDRLYLTPSGADDAVPLQPLKLEPGRTLLPGGLGVLELAPGAERGLSDAVVAQGLELRPRVGGEKILLPGQSHRKKLKKLLQEEGVVPWMRERLPLVYAGDELVAVADLFVAAGAEARPGTAISWHGRPSLD